MKVVFGFLLLCVVVLSVDAVCDVVCTGLPSTVSEDNNCEYYRKVYDCLVSTRESCSDASRKTSLQFLIDTNVSTRRGIRCGAAGLTVSLFTLLLALFAAFRKL